MRPYIWLVALSIIATSVALGDDSFVAKTQIYTDNDHTTVVSPLVALSRDAWKGGTLNASYVMDVVSSASIDVVSNATRHMNDLRSEITAGASQKWRNATFSGSYIYSTEHDYSSNNVALGYAQDFFQRNSTLALGYTVSDNNIGRVGDQAFHRSLLVNGVSIAWTQVLNKSTIAQLSYTFGYDSGYQASPYRFVRVEAPDFSSTQFKVAETDPLDRVRHAAVIGLNHHIFSDSSIQGDYRFYADSWGIIAHTVQARYFVNFKGVTLRLHARFYYQTDASFYQPHYTTLSHYMTADRELSNFWSVLAGPKVSWRLPWVHRALLVEAKVEMFYFDYLNFALLPSRIGANTELGLSVIY